MSDKISKTGWRDWFPIFREVFRIFVEGGTTLPLSNNYPPFLGIIIYISTNPFAFLFKNPITKKKHIWISKINYWTWYTIRGYGNRDFLSSIEVAEQSSDIEKYVPPSVKGGNGISS